MPAGPPLIADGYGDTRIGLSRTCPVSGQATTKGEGLWLMLEGNVERATVIEGCATI